VVLVVVILQLILLSSVYR